MPEDSQFQIQRSERVVARSDAAQLSPAPPAAAVDVEALAARVYRLMLDDVLRHRERA
ncbi:MAG TPA: hypothetical protein VKV73_02580 [Chloroflexota bacterium]|nr:hypothetical protein [Chloroflexota bacterium]